MTEEIENLNEILAQKYIDKNVEAFICTYIIEKGNDNSTKPGLIGYRVIYVDSNKELHKADLRILRTQKELLKIFSEKYETSISNP